MQICDVATRLFHERGFNGTSVQEISDAVGVQKGSLYHYIDSKEDLLFQVLQSLHEGGMTVIEQVQYGTNNPLNQLKSYLKSMTVYAGIEADRLSIFFRDFQFILPEQQRKIISERDIYVKVTERLIFEAIQCGMVRPNIHIRVAALTIMSAVTSTREWYRPAGALGLEGIAEQTADLLVNGLVGLGGAGKHPNTSSMVKTKPGRTFQSNQ
jgi:AcrR family transcriptional regulator